MVKADSEFCLTGDRDAHGKISGRTSLVNTRARPYEVHRKALVIVTHWLKR